MGISMVKRKRARHGGGQGRQLVLPGFHPGGSAPFLPGGRSPVCFPTTIPLSGRGKADRIAGSLSRSEEGEPR